MRDDRRSGAILHHASRIAPLAAAAMLFGVLFAGRINAGEVPGASEYRDAVRAAVEGLPYFIGRWRGVDVDTPPAAIQLLKPNVIQQRRFVDPTTGRVFSLLIVHCSDTRDMRGHYPPVCYPAHGWQEAGVAPTTITIGGQAYPARTYDFVRVVEGVEQRLHIFSFFVLPDGSIVADDAALDRASSKRYATQLGAAQFQIVGGENLPESERREVVDEFVRALEGPIRIIARGVRDDG